MFSIFRAARHPPTEFAELHQAVGKIFAIGISMPSGAVASVKGQVGQGTNGTKPVEAKMAPVDEEVSIPIPSMHGIFTYIYHKNQPSM